MLEAFAKLYDKPGTDPMQAKLPAIYSREILEVLNRVSQVAKRFRDIPGGLYSTEHWHETNQDKDGTIRRETDFPATPNDLVVSGPHFHVGSPLYKTPNEGCKTKQDYSPVDLTEIPDDYLPRTNYFRACSPEEYRIRTPSWGGVRSSECYRIVFRNMLNLVSERSLIPCIMPPGPAHINTVVSVGFLERRALLNVAGVSMSLLYDFLIRASGRGHLYPDDFGKLPLPSPGIYETPLILRTLLLNCLTNFYAPLWNEHYSDDFRTQSFTLSDPRLPNLRNLSRTWSWDTPLRTAFSRRQALLEIDVLAALMLGLSLEELITIYRVNFAVLQTYDNDTWYDQAGRIVFTSNRGLSGVGLDRRQFEEIRKAAAGAHLPDWANQYFPPFDRCDREFDYKAAYEYFSGWTSDASPPVCTVQFSQAEVVNADV